MTKYQVLSTNIPGIPDRSLLLVEINKDESVATIGDLKRAIQDVRGVDYDFQKILILGHEPGDNERLAQQPRANHFNLVPKGRSMINYDIQFVSIPGYEPKEMVVVGMPPNATIKDLKEKLGMVHGINVEQERIMIDNLQPRDSEKLSNYGHAKMIKLILDDKVEYLVKWNNRIIAVDISSSAHVGDLKEVAAKQFNLDPREVVVLRLVGDDNQFIVENDARLGAYPKNMKGSYDFRIVHAPTSPSKSPVLMSAASASAASAATIPASRARTHTYSVLKPERIERLQVDFFLDPKTFAVNIDTNKTILDLKMKIEEAYNYPVASQYITFNCKDTRDSDELHQFANQDKKLELKLIHSHLSAQQQHSRPSQRSQYGGTHTSTHTQKSTSDDEYYQQKYLKYKKKYVSGKYNDW